jgi:hypothetical protein
VASALAMTLCEPVSSPGVGAIAVNDPALIANLVDAAELCVNPYRVVAKPSERQNRDSAAKP